MGALKGRPYTRWRGGAWRVGLRMAMGAKTPARRRRYRGRLRCGLVHRKGNMDNNLEITPSELKQTLDRGEKILLIDVREPWEYNLCNIGGSKLIPMGSIPANLQAIDSGEPVVCYCHHGMRSLDVTVWLRDAGS